MHDSRSLRYEKIKNVEGWLSEQAADFTERLLAHLGSTEGKNAVGEFGVHKGKYLSLIYAASQPWSHRVLGVDGFFDGSGNVLSEVHRNGAMSSIRKNVSLLSPDISKLELLGSDTRQLTVDSVRELMAAPIAFISIDGGHDVATVEHDLNVALPNMSARGVAALDDAFNPICPGVAEGIFRFLNKYKDLFAPFAICGNKLFVTRSGSHHAWLDFATEQLHESSMDYLKRSQVLARQQETWGELPSLFGHRLVTFVN
jgi:hypothetical protein